jgi:hypothetical protein
VCDLVGWGDGELHWTIRDVAVVSGCGTG